MVVRGQSQQRVAGEITTDVRRNYVNLIDALIRNGHMGMARQAAELAVDQGVWANPWQRPVDYQPHGSDQPVHRPEGFWFVAYLEENYPRIRAEIEAVTSSTKQGFAPVEEPLLDAGRWDQVTLYESGRRQEQACAMFPVTTEVIDQIPEATTIGPGVVTLSWLEPGTHIVPHCGRTNTQLRVHLGLRIPDKVSIRVGEHHLTWQEGRCIVFDDSFEHEVWHRGTEPRLVLLMDVIYPGLDERHRARVLAGRRTPSDLIAGYLAEHAIRRIETDGDEILMRPSTGAAALIRRYMIETGARAVELRDSDLHFEYATDRAR